jgi:nuclear-control-of-ATPase protein 2
MEVVPAESNESKDLKTLFSFYSSYLWNRVVGFFPSSGSNFLGKISNLYRQAARAGYRSRRKCLPLPLPSNSLDSSLYASYFFL